MFSEAPDPFRGSGIHDRRGQSQFQFDENSSCTIFPQRAGNPIGFSGPVLLGERG